MHKRRTEGSDPIRNVYSGQGGSGSLPFFVGKQYGTGWLRSLARLAFPILKKAVGSAGNVASNTADDLLENRKSFKESLKDNTIGEATRLFTGSGTKRHFSTATINKPKRIKTRHTIFSH